MHFFFLMMCTAGGLLLSSFFPVYAQSGLPVPRFVSLSSNEVYVRSGPGKTYPVKWIYQRRDYPVEVVREYDVWRKIRDRDGDVGWVYQGLLSSKRTALIETEKAAPLFRKPVSDSTKIAYVENGAQVALEECDTAWCDVYAQGINGWIERKYLYGIYEAERID